MCTVQVISATQMAKGFRRLLDAAADLRLDVPEAPHQIAAFIARAVADNVLPPAFVEDIPAGANCSSISGCASFPFPTLTLWDLHKKMEEKREKGKKPFRVPCLMTCSRPPLSKTSGQVQ